MAALLYRKQARGGSARHDVPQSGSRLSPAREDLGAILTSTRCTNLYALEACFHLVARECPRPSGKQHRGINLRFGGTLSH